MESRVTPVFCKKTNKLLFRIDTESLTALASVPGGCYPWCRDCHMQHHILWADIAQQAREQTPDTAPGRVRFPG